MASRKRVLGLPQAFAPGAVACLLLGAGACSGGAAGGEPSPTAQAGTGGRATGAGGFGGDTTGGANTVNPIVISSAGAPCTDVIVPDPVFAAQFFDSSRPARRELYSWTTDEQAAIARRDKELFTLVEAQGLGPGFAFVFLQQLATGGTDPEQAQLATLLTGDLFAKKRYAWTEPWATRMGWPGEDYGNQLLRIVLKPEAWVVVVDGATLRVLDQNNEPVSLAQAIANPQRLGAIFYEKGARLGGPVCNSSFTSGSNGYREFILGNLAMVEEWSLGTAAIRDRLTANIDQLTRFLERIRSCPSLVSGAQWNRSVCCNWQTPAGQLARTELFTYQQALAIPSLNYLPQPAQIASLIATLQGDLFELDPMVVASGSP